MSSRAFNMRNRSLQLGERTLIMGIVNVTPDSFSDGGEAFELDSAVDRALQMVEDGADILDIGGESTRPGSDRVTLDDELQRVIPVIEALQGKTDAVISIDSYKAEVARQAMEAGAQIINDISAGNFDPEMVKVAAHYNAGVVLMHIKGEPNNMQKDPQYDDVISEVREFLSQAVNNFTSAGFPVENILVDPGIGFGKQMDHNLTLLRNLSRFKGLGAGVLLGASRKSFIGALTGNDVKERVYGSVGSAVAGSIFGADIVRVHDVKATHEALVVSDAMRLAG